MEEEKKLAADFRSSMFVLHSHFELSFSVFSWACIITRLSFSFVAVVDKDRISSSFHNTKLIVGVRGKR